MTVLKALTIWRPWSDAIAASVKLIENRSWKPPASAIGSQIAIHSGKKFDHDAAKEILSSGLWVPPSEDESPAGAIVAVAMLENVVEESDSPWFTGRYGWVFSDVQRLANPVWCRGAQGLWQVPDDVASSVVEEV